MRHAINWNMVYDLPFGRGRMFGASMPLILDEIVGGWKVGMTGVAYTGFPVNISATNNSGVNGNSQRANHYRPLKIVNRSINNWFGTDPSAVPCTVAGRRQRCLRLRSAGSWNLRHRSSHIGTCTGLPDLRCLRHEGLHRLA